MAVLKKVLKFILYILILAAGILVISLLHTVDPAQHPDPKFINGVTRSYEQQLTQLDFDSLYQNYGKLKVLPEGYEKAAILALAHYPQLKEVPIVFELNTESAPMEATFQYWSLLGIGDRKYRIRLNIARNVGYDEILMYSLPFDAQIGILAHELGHVVYYEKLNLFQIIKWALLYLVDDNFRSTHESTTDLMPIYHGLGWQIYNYAYYLSHNEATRDWYQRFGSAFIDKFYMTHEEIKTRMEELGAYEE